MRIGIDFDRTIFDTDGFKQHLESRFPKFSKLYDDAVEDGIYKPRLHAELMGVGLEELFSEMRNCERFVYDDIDNLEKITGGGHELILVTRGDVEIQRLKIKGSGIQDYFDTIEIISKSIDDIPKNQAAEIDILADDRQEELDAVDIRTVKTDPDEKSVANTVEKILRAANDE